MVHNVPMRLVLASAPPARRATLIAAGITPIVQVSTVDEDAVLAALPGGRAFSGGTTNPADEVAALAAAKCTDVCKALSAPGTNAELPEDEAVLVVGCDSMLEIDGQMLGKPHTPHAARPQRPAARPRRSPAPAGAPRPPSPACAGRPGMRTHRRAPPGPRAGRAAAPRSARGSATRTR